MGPPDEVEVDRVVGVEVVAVAVMEAVFADAGVGVDSMVNRAVEAEFDVFVKAKLGFDFSRVGSGSSKGRDSFVGVRFVGCAVEARAEQFLVGVKAMAGFEVRELAVHSGEEEADDEPAILGFLGDDVG